MVRGVPAEMTAMSAATEGFVHPEYLIETESLPKGSAIRT